MPWELGNKLYEDNKLSCDVTLKTFDADLDLGHSRIYRAEDLPATIENFLNRLV